MRKRIKVDYLSRVEGEGGIRIEIRGGRLHQIDLRIFEAPRFFEPILRGRSFQDVIDFTARICGICPVAYQMSAVHAIEALIGIDVDEEVRRLRRLLYAAEWIESHALHVYLLHGPDFYGLESAWSGKGYMPVLQRGLLLKRLGNELLTIIGGRPVHPVSVRVGGFFKMPDRERLMRILPSLQRGYEEAVEGIRWAASLFNGRKEASLPIHTHVSLRDPEGYPMNRGEVVTSEGREFSMRDFLSSVEEYQVSHSTALHSVLRDGSNIGHYMVGPVARLNLNHHTMPEGIGAVMSDSGIRIPITDAGMSIVARSVEIAYAFNEAIRIIRDYTGVVPEISFEFREGTAVWITEAPRGMLIHDYEFDREGRVRSSRLITPTSQNLSHIERTLKAYIESNIEKSAETLKKGSEQIVRSYDPCISCSVHVVKV